MPLVFSLALLLLPLSGLAQDTAKDTSPALSTLPSVYVRTFDLTGNTVLPSQSVQTVLGGYQDRFLTGDELQQVASRLSSLYIENGYVSSGVIVPEQHVSDGTVILRANEGRLTTVSVTGTRRFADSYFTKRLAVGTGTPLRVEDLRQVLLRFEQDPRIESIQASLKPGLERGDSTLDLAVRERPPFHIGFEIGNTNPPTTGEWRAMLHALHTNLTGQGDVLDLQFGGSKQFFDNPKYFQCDLSYQRPLNAYDTTLRLRYARYQTVITEQPFDTLDIESNTNLYQISLAQPVYRNNGRTLSLGLTGDYRYNMTYVSGRPFSLSEGSQDGKSAESVLRLFQEYIAQSQDQVIAAYSSFNFGINALDATYSGEPSGRFFSWLGQFKWLRRLFKSNWQLFCRTDMQFTPDRLLDMEKFSVGGMNSVRGYRENRLVRDAGLSGSVELRVPLLTDFHSHSLQLVPFYDFGNSFNSKNIGNPYPDWISSAGVGIKWQYKDMLLLQFYKAFPFVAFHDHTQYLQDLGYHFQCSVNFTF